jgi:hypothetical protein
MATINSAGSTNDYNLVLMRTGLKILRYTDRKTGAFARGALLSRLGGFEQEATKTNPFTFATS